MSKKRQDPVADKAAREKADADAVRQYVATRPSRPEAAAKAEMPPAKSTFREYVEAFGTALLLALFIRTFIVQAFKIPSGSMLPTLQIGDHLLVNKLAYGIRIPFVAKRIFQVFKPQHDDVIVFLYPADRSKDYIKRVKAIAGETIEVKNKVVYINGEKIDDPYAFHDPHSRGSMNDFGPFTVPDGYVFAMGDNRENSSDSRFWGPVPIGDIEGKAFIIYFSFWDDTWKPRLERVGNLIH
ncbi:MAG TPA: signal peptidase I [Candidatus Limnocylindrales bacterium]|nr:signal peptidase I [Candidatus Limnocylindrales bacterium]